MVYKELELINNSLELEIELSNDLETGVYYHFPKLENELSRILNKVRFINKSNKVYFKLPDEKQLSWSEIGLLIGQGY